MLLSKVLRRWEKFSPNVILRMEWFCSKFKFILSETETKRGAWDLSFGLLLH